MKLVIEIPDKDYEVIRNIEKLSSSFAVEGVKNFALSMIETATPLSESEDCVSRQAVLEVWKEIKKEIEHKKFRTMEVQMSDAHLGFNGGLECALAIIDRHLQEVKE